MLRLNSVSKAASTLTALCLLAILLGVPGMAKAETVREWTVMVYLDGDNNLDLYSVQDIEEMKTIGSTDKVNVLVLWDRYSEPAYLYKVVKDDLVLMEGLMVDGKVVNGQEISMSDWRVLRAFVQYGEATLRAEHYMLVLWDHGSPWGYACWDDHFSPEWIPDAGAISLDGLTDALSGTERLDILAFDACTIGMVEIAYELASIPSEKGVQLQYLVASEEYVSYYGYPYTQVLERMNSMEDLGDSEAVARMVADEYAVSYSAHGQCKGNSPATLSVIDLAKVAPAIPTIKALTERLADGLEADFKHYHRLIADARGEGNLPWSMNGWDQRIDISTFLLTLSSTAGDDSVRMLADSAADALMDAVYVTNTKAMASAGALGLGVWFPASYRSIGNANLGYWSLVEYPTVFGFAEDAGWMSFLYAYWKAPKT